MEHQKIVEAIAAGDPLAPAPPPPSTWRKRRNACAPLIWVLARRWRRVCPSTQWPRRTDVELPPLVGVAVVSPGRVRALSYCPSIHPMTSSQPAGIQADQADGAMGQYWPLIEGVDLALPAPPTGRSRSATGLLRSQAWMTPGVGPPVERLGCPGDPARRFTTSTVQFPVDCADRPPETVEAWRQSE